MNNKLKEIKAKLNNKFVAGCATVSTVMTAVTVSVCAAETGTGTTTYGSLPADVSPVFGSLATGLIATIGVVAVAALGVYAAPQAITVAKKIFKKVSA